MGSADKWTRKHPFRRCNKPPSIRPFATMNDTMKNKSEITTTTTTKTAVPSMGPEPTLLSRKEVDALYETMQVVVKALSQLQVEYIITSGGSLLGAIRQHSILFCDDDIDIAILDIDDNNKSSSSTNSSCNAYDKVSTNLQQLLGPNYQYQIRPWEGGDRVRPKQMNNVFVDIFVLRRYNNMDELKSVIGIKKNGQPQSDQYVHDIVQTIQECATAQGETAPLFPLWHFHTRKAIEMWPKEVYRHDELFPLCRTLRFGPLTGIQGPRMPVLLLKRAFGPDCFEVYYQSGSHQTNTKTGASFSSSSFSSSNHQHHTAKKDNNDGDFLPPLVSLGGMWEGGTKQKLSDIHYIPMQPIARAARRPTMHNKEQLFHYLKSQIEKERTWQQQQQQDMEKQLLPNGGALVRPPRRTVYMDTVADLFHVGHLQAIRQCAQLGDRVIIGVVGDKDACGYKRPPIIKERDRVAIVQAIREVDQVICPCPFIITKEFMEEHDIDLVVHGFANEADSKRQEEFFAVPVQMGKFKRISYYNGLSTSQIIQKIQSQTEVVAKDQGGRSLQKHKPQWFGSAVASATNNAENIDFDPFPLALRQVIEPHIRKATNRRKAILDAIQKATGNSSFDETYDIFLSTSGKEGSFFFDVDRYPLRSSLLAAGSLAPETDLSRLHEQKDAKDRLLFSLTQNYTEFQEVFDRFVRQVCVPHLASFFDCDEMFYQAFPCVRVVQPKEFSIGPHSDLSYGHSPFSTNFYVPLTKIEKSSSAVFLETRPGSEDWHPILGDYGFIKHFAGGVCTHWTTENMCAVTRKCTL